MSILPSLEDLKGSIGDVASGALDDLTDLARDPGNKIIDVVSGYDLDERGRVRDEQESGNSERSDIYSKQAGLESAFTEFDPRSLVPDSFDSMSHEAIKSAVDVMSADPIRASAEGWAKIGSSLEEGLAGFKTDITAEIDGKWEGVGAGAAMAATTNYVAESDKLAAAGTLVGTKVAEAATGISQVKATMPAVEATSMLESLVNVALPSVGMVKELVHGSDEARQQAIQIMKTVYTPVMVQSDTNVPRFPPPPNLTGTSDPTLPGAPGIGSPSGAAPSGYSGPGSPESGTSPSDPTRQGTDGASTGTPGASPGDESAGQHPLSPDDSTSGTNPNSPFAQTDPSSAWTAPAAAGGADGTGGGLGSGTGSGGYGSGGYGSGGSGSGFTPGGGSGGGSYGSGAGAGAGLSGLSGAGGVSGGLGGGMGVPGGAGAAAGAGGSGGGVAGAAGRPGAMGGGMAPGGARANGDDDTEHNTPSYLINVDNGNELVGTLPKVAPPVIGG